MRQSIIKITQELLEAQRKAGTAADNRIVADNTDNMNK
jgi:hypothetical protein